jgi:hypothetical protein
MPVIYDVLLRPDATPSQLRAVGAALWRWCIRTAGEENIFRYLDNQALADLTAGRHPTPIEPGSQRGSHFRARDELSRDRQTAVDGLRGEMPEEGILDILVDGTSWHRPIPDGPPGNSIVERRGQVLRSSYNDLATNTMRGHR